MRKESKSIVVADKHLGKVMREFIEVDRKADVGDYVTYVFGGNRDDVAVKVEDIDVRGGVHFDSNPYIDQDGEECDGFGDGAYCTLLPTNIVHIGGERYRMVNRLPEVGEKVIVTASPTFLHVGTVGVCMENDEFNDGSIDMQSPLGYQFINGTYDQYRVLEPLETRIGVDATQASPEVLDLLANLARRVTSLEQQLRDTQGNVERQAEELAEYRDDYLACGSGLETLDKEVTKVSELVEMALDDIALLDDRTNVINAIQKFYGGARR